MAKWLSFFVSLRIPVHYSSQYYRYPYLSELYLAVLRIRDVYPGSQVKIFFIPDARSWS